MIRKLFYFICLSAHIFYLNNVYAESSQLQVNCTEEVFDTNDIEEDDYQDESIILRDDEPFLSFLDTPQKFISTGVEAFAKNIDEFFSDEKVFYDSSGTYLRLRIDTNIEERGKRTYLGDFKLKLRVPHTKKKYKFTLESDPNERPDEISGQGSSTPVAAVEEKKYFAGLQAELGEKDAWQFNPSIGIRLSSPIEPYFKLRVKKKFEFDRWNLHFQETPYWFDSSGWGADSYLELNRKITDKDLFRASTFARWTNESDLFELSQTFTMYHTLTERRAVSYFVGVYGESEPTVYATHYLLGLTYRQNIHKDYFFVELIPQIKYEKVNDFHSEHSIIIRFEIIFKK